MERDEFVDNAYAAAGIPLIHVWNPISPEELEQILLEVLPSFAEDTDFDDTEANDATAAPDEDIKEEEGSCSDPSSETAIIPEAEHETCPDVF